MIRKDPEAKNVLAIKREKPILKPGRIECNNPIETAEEPAIKAINGSLPKSNDPKKKKPVPIKATIAPTEKPVQVAQNVLW